MIKAKQSADGTLSVSVYRKPTHTDQYLSFESHHPLEHKLSVIRTLTHRADFAITDPEDKQKELDHIRAALGKCGYKPWTFHKALKSIKKQKPSASSATAQKSKGQITIPYVKGTSEKLRRTYQQYGVSVTFKPLQTLRQRLVAPKDPTELEEKTGVIYHIPCKDCSSVYIGETGRKLKLRLREHKSTAPSANSPVSAHTKSGHNIDWEGVKVLEKDNRSDTRKIREEIYIKKDPNPKINTSKGFELSPIYNSLLRSANKNTASGNTSRNTGSQLLTTSTH